MKLYSFSLTPNNRKVEAYIRHFSLPVEIYSMGFRDQENTTDTYLRMNPMGKAPLLADGDFYLWESNAILCYLATLYPETGMLPIDAKGRADCDRWLYWQAFHLLSTIVGLSDKKKSSTKDIDLNLGTLNTQLEGRDFIRGELSIVDFAIAPYLSSKRASVIDQSNFPNVEAWVARCNALKGMIDTVYNPQSS
jgi:glutathione S-transferase